jgi:hypothetical protein
MTCAGEGPRCAVGANGPELASARHVEATAIAMTRSYCRCATQIQGGPASAQLSVALRKYQIEHAHMVEAFLENDDAARRYLTQIAPDF